MTSRDTILSNLERLYEPNAGKRTIGQASLGCLLLNREGTDIALYSLREPIDYGNLERHDS